MLWRRAKIARSLLSKMPSAKCTVSNSTQKFAIQNTATTYCVTLPLTFVNVQVMDNGQLHRYGNRKNPRTSGRQKVLLGLSGGVDSSVVGVLFTKAIGDQLTCIFVDHGLLRKGEAEQVMEPRRQIRLEHHQS